MSDRVSHSLRLALAWLRTASAWLAHKVCCLWRRFRQHRRSIAVEALIADRARRKALEREIKTGLAGLQRALGAALLADASVIVQQVIVTDHQVAGCCQVGQRLDGEPFALVRLALQVNGHVLTTDELLAVLAEQCIGLATQQGVSAIIPVELEPTVANGHTPTPLSPDPLAPHANGSRRAVARQDP